MAEEIKVIRVGDILTNLIDPVTKLSVQYSKVLNWYDGTPMTDAKLDSYGIYVKKGSEYFLKSLGEYGQILQKNTMTEMRNLSGLEILLLRMGYYNSVQLNGYYEKGDTPAPIEYVLSETSDSDNGGNVIELASGLKLVHDIQQEINVRYFGARPLQGFDNKVPINNALLATKRVVIDDGEWEVSVSSGGYGTGGIVLQNFSDLNLSKNAVVKQISGSISVGNLLGVNNKRGFKVTGGTWIGDKHRHLTPEGTYWVQRQNSTTYSEGDYIYENGWGFKVETSGISGSSLPTLNSSVTVGDTVSDGTISLLVVNSYLTSSLGERMHGFWINNSKEGVIRDTEFREFWGDGLYLGGASNATYRGAEDILVENVYHIDNRRQGASVVQAERVTFRNCQFNQTGGTNPRAGVDIEPNDLTHWVKDVTFETCRFDNNEGSGIELVTINEGPFIDGVIISNCFFNGNRFDTRGYTVQEGERNTIRNVKLINSFVNVDNRDNAVRFRNTSNFDVISTSITKPTVNERNVFGVQISNNCSDFNLSKNTFRGFSNISVRIDTGARNWTFRGNTAEDGTNFLYASDSQNFVISDNMSANLSNRGVWLANCSEGQVLSNTYKNNESGSNIVLDNGSNDITVKGNTCINPRVQGILVVGDSNRNLITDNTIISYGGTQRAIVTSGVTGVGGNIVGLNHFIGTFTAGKQQLHASTVMFPQIQQQNGVLSFEDGDSTDITQILTESKPDGVSVEGRAVVRSVRAVSPSSVNYPAAAGGGIYYQRNDGTGMGAFTLFKGNTNDLDLYLQTSTGKFAPFQFIMSGPSSDRPSGVERVEGTSFFDTDLGYYIFWNGTNWVNMLGEEIVVSP